jgi:menaquinone-9 beta-reductase
LYFGIACGRELTAVLQQQRPRAEALERYAAFSAEHARAFAIAGRLQRMVPALPPRLLMSGLRLLGRQWLIDRSFRWYLDQAPPSYVALEVRDAPRPAGNVGLGRAGRA